MDIEKWILDMDILMNKENKNHEDHRRYDIICEQDNDSCYIEGLDACMCYDEIRKYGCAMEYWVDRYNLFYKTEFEPIKKKHRKFFYWVTCTGKIRIDDSKINIEKMHKFGLNIFNNNSYTRYYKCYWNIETGKYKDKPNLHIHALIIFDSTNKNFKRDFVNAFKKIFNNYDYKENRFGTKLTEIFQDKYEYLKNDNKSVLHQNYRDLDIFECVEL